MIGIAGQSCPLADFLLLIRGKPASDYIRVADLLKCEDALRITKQKATARYRSGYRVISFLPVLSEWLLNQGFS